MRKLCEMADIITPNRTEARLLLGDAPDEEAVSNEELLAGLHNENVIITSVRRGDKIGYLARLGTEIVRIEKPMVHRAAARNRRRVHLGALRRGAQRAATSKTRCLPRQTSATAASGYCEIPARTLDTGFALRGAGANGGKMQK